MRRAVGAEKSITKVTAASKFTTKRLTADGRRAADEGDPKYTEITPLVITGFLAAVAECGRPTQVCRDLRIHYPTIHALKRDDPDFKIAFDQAMAQAYDGFEDEARRRAFEGYLKPVYQQGMRVGEVREFSDALAMMMLKAGKPEAYNPKTELQLDHKGGIAFGELSDEEINKRINDKLTFLYGKPQNPGTQVTADEALHPTDVPRDEELW